MVVKTTFVVLLIWSNHTQKHRIVYLDPLGGRQKIREKPETRLHFPTEIIWIYHPLGVSEHVSPAGLLSHGLSWDLHRIPRSSRKWRCLQVGHQHLHRWLQGFGSTGRPTGHSGHWREALGRRGCRGQVKVACSYIYIYISYYMYIIYNYHNICILYIIVILYIICIIYIYICIHI